MLTAAADPLAGDVDIGGTAVMAKLDAATAAVLLRYFAGNGRWEVRADRGLRYAVRREQPESSLNGFYSGSSPDRQTRVIVSFGRPHGIGNRDDWVTRVAAGAGAVHLRTGGPRPGSPGQTSYLIVEGGGVFLEVYEQSTDTARPFTQATLKEVSAEIADVLAHEGEIKTAGRLADGARYPAPAGAPGDAPTPRLLVEDGMQPGIYQLRADIAPPWLGVVHARVFRVADGERLSEDRLTPASSRIVGWSSDGTGLFPYSAQVTVYEGDWSTAYDARFELWFRDESGAERKLASATRSIHGWQQ